MSIFGTKHLPYTAENQVFCEDAHAIMFADHLRSIGQKMHNRQKMLTEDAHLSILD